MAASAPAARPLFGHLEVLVYKPSRLYVSLRTLHGLMCRASRTEAVTGIRERRVPRSCSTCNTTRWMGRSSAHAMPRLRTPHPCGLGISTLLTGCGLQVPLCSVARIDGQCSRRNAGSARTVMPSTPGAPLFAFTRFNACFGFSGSQTSSICRSQADGLPDSGCAA